MQENSRPQRKFSFLIFPSLFIVLIWLIFGLEYLLELDLGTYSVEPRTANGLLGILFFPLLHASLEHIAGNTVSLFVLLVGVRYIFPQLFFRVFTLSYILPGVFTWIIGRPSFHLGASGMIYSLVVFMFFSGVIRVNRYLLALSLLVVFLYGGLFWGIFPLEQGISWEGHLGGALTGFFMAIWFRKEPPIEEIVEREPEWDEDEIESEFDDWHDANDDLSNQSHIVYHYKPSNHEQNSKNK